MQSKEIEKYILEHIDKEDDVLEKLNRETNLNVLGARMLSGHLQGQILSMLSKLVRPERILEIGTFTGYSAICLAKGLRENGRLITIEIDDELESFARKYFEKAGLAEKIIQRIGPATKIIPTLQDSFDLVFIDADKKEYVSYYNLIFGKVKTGGLIITDNTLWSGKVLRKPTTDDQQTAGVIKFNEMVKNDDRVEKVILPVRDGITLIRKK